MAHPIKQYHHYLHHSNFGAECTACPHTHPEIENKVYVVAALLGSLFLFHAFNRSKHRG